MADDTNKPINIALTKGGKLAADMIRKKIDALYANEPDAKEEQREAEVVYPRSKHQEFMHQLSTSGKPLAEVQTAWHNYYVNLPDDEKHQVWQEFYSAHGQSVQAAPQHQSAPTASAPQPAHTPSSHPAKRQPARKKVVDPRTISDVKQQILRNVNARGKLSTKHHVQSVVFGVGIGSMALLIMLFGLFNERIIAPFITPSKNVSNTPIIVDPNSVVADATPKVIIPKINVEIPVVYDEPSIEEHAIQNALERGVVHYATTASPGEMGNPVIFGHSSNNILNKGKYKFAFVLLHRLEIGDTFMLTKNGKRYVYRVTERKVVKPTDVSVLTAATTQPMATLITCDPPGTSLNRLVVSGVQVSPEPGTNVASTAAKTNEQPKIVPSNAPSLWSRLTGWITS
jgi:sortase A